ncbi:NADPH-dependent diflavin oxidoreductase 1 isoform X4 [Cephus cinctus]|uniref:NADPH-dependent diflavin oxidoreductase 1 n=1 Tax=Cephus cinctus TaxID=211228 RepID=A0AAJ7RG66_CEPCN|nr:NADPH-dependent diflavin oxidoreductase 1 isoform X4 [Cephus cinctus]
MTTSLTVLYGSETGTAQDTAEQIWRDAKRMKLKCSVAAMDEYNIEKLISEKLVVFVIATTGQGEPPLNMRRTWRFLLRKNLPSTSLINVQYAVLGLGDSSYQKYNYAAKKLRKRLAQLGARELIPIGLADDQHDLGIDGTVGPWVEELWTKVSEIFNISKEIYINRDQEVIQRFDVTVINSTIINGTNNQYRDIYKHEMSLNESLKIGTVLENNRTTSDDHFQDVRLIKLQAEGLDYTPGDVLYVRPKNSPEQVQKFFTVLNDHGVNAYPNMVIRVTGKEIKVPSVLTRDLTLQEVAEQYWDLSFKPRRSTMQTLAFISDDELEKEKLIEFTTPTGQEELFNYVTRPRRNIIEVLHDFPHTTRKLNIKLLFEIMSPIKPRAFSIASSLNKTKNEIHILVAVVKYKTKLLEPRLGLCSNWLADLKLREEVIFWIQKGTFKFDYNKPMILIGPGTGVAPFRSLLLEKASTNKDLSDCILFFGCRSKLKDYHCKEDFETLSQTNGLRLFCAFSRDQEQKIYVQHVIRDQSELCWKFLKSSANIYLAGTEPVRLSPGWEGTGRPEDELNFKGVTMDQADLEINPPNDRLNIVFLILLLHGIGSLMPWNMFITAKDYFVDYKMSKNYTSIDPFYTTNFLPILGFAAQIPNLLFNWLNIFIQLGGNLTTRIVWGIFVEVLIFVFTIVLAMIDTSAWSDIFFWITMISVVMLNTASGIYQNSIFGMAAKLPFKYTGAVVLGSNISGTFTAIINLIAQIMAPNVRTAAIYYFITALFVLLACFDTYFALPINRFYRYHELLHKKESKRRQLEHGSRGVKENVPYWTIFRQCLPQCFNIFFLFFVTLSIFPSVHSDIRRSDPNFIIPADYYSNVMCFLTFNITAMIGSSIASMVQWPSKNYLVFPIILRALYIPLFLLCNYQPKDIQRVLPVLINNDWLYLIIAITMGLTSGYFSSIAMMYCPRMVESHHAATAGMFGAASLITGIFTGILFSMVMPYVISLHV